MIFYSQSDFMFSLLLAAVVIGGYFTWAKLATARGWKNAPQPYKRQCPYCASKIRYVATVCPRCGREIGQA
jgi:hypothetical protein